MMGQLPKRKILLVTLALFAGSSLIAVLVNSFAFGHGWDVSRSISRYVGFETWSSLMFAAANIGVTVLMMSFLWRLGEAWRMPRLFYYLAVILGITLVLLSVFPVGYFDQAGHISLESRIHEVSSRTMFIAMMLEAAMIAGNRYASRMTQAVSLAYVLYGVICVVGYLMEAPWFLAALLIFEWTYVAAFVVVLLACKSKSRRE